MHTLPNVTIHNFRSCESVTLDFHESWTTLRQALCIQQRVTASLRRKDGRSIHVRKSTVAEPAAMAIYQALDINSQPGGSRKIII